MSLKKITAELGNTVFSLPYLVADERGYFADEGLEVAFVQHREPVHDDIPDIVEDHRAVSAFGRVEPLFEVGEAALYRACEWGQVRRSHDTRRDGRVIAKRAAVATQSIVVRPESPVEVPGDLAGLSVGVNFHHGSHYMALGLLEGFIPRDQLRVVHIDGPKGREGWTRFTALRDGHVDAATLMEPWTTVAEKLGYKTIVEGHYHGLEVAGEDLDADTFEAVNRAIRRAVADLQADPLPFTGYLIADVPEDIVRLEPSDFSRNRLRYTDPAPYPEDAFQRTYDWMVSWGLIADDSTFDDLVDNRVAIAV